MKKMESIKLTSNKSNNGNNNKKSSNEINNPTVSKNDLRDDQDHYCWVCHKDKINLSCNICPRSYHLKCLNNNPSYSQLESYTLLNDKSLADNWVCFECELIAKAESDEGKSESLRRISRNEFCELLNHAVSTIKKSTDITFHTPVNLDIYTDYSDFVIHPMDFYKIEQYIKTRKYCSTEAFLSDCKWILHNCYIFNSSTNPLTLNARYMLKIAKNEVYELETCPDCYRNLYTNDVKDFFIQTCSYPHNLCLAKLKGHPMWPSKVVKYNPRTKEAEVRFFGAHDKAWVTLDSCILLSEIPTTSKVNKNQRNKLELAIKELEAHIELLNEKFPGLFKFSPPKTTLKPNEVYLIPLPEYITQPSVSSSTNPPDNKNTSSSENINPTLENNLDKNVQPSKKQRKTPSTSSTPSTPSTSVTRTPANKNKHSIKEAQQIPIEQDFSHINDDSDDDNEHKLVIADDIFNEDKKRNLNKRKRVDSSSSSTKNSVNSNVSTTKVNIQKRKSLIESPAQTVSTSKSQSQLHTKSVLSKKKMKKGLNDSVSSNSSFNYLLPMQTGGLSDNEKVDQLIKQVQYLKDELERSRSLHIEEIKEMFENHKSEFRDLKTSLDEEKAAELTKLRKELEQKHAKQIEEIKRKSWCTNCLKQACFFCCRLASYCSYECQSVHWASHMTTCLQKAIDRAASTTASEQAKSERDNSIQISSGQDTSLNTENTLSDKIGLIEQENKCVSKQVEAESINSSPINSLNQKNEKIVAKKSTKHLIEADDKQKLNTENTTNDIKETEEKSFEKMEIVNKNDLVQSTNNEQLVVNKCKLNPEKPKDRFLKKLNENNLLDSVNKAEEQIESAQIINENDKTKNADKLESDQDQQFIFENLSESENKQQVLSKTELAKPINDTQHSDKEEKLTIQDQPHNEVVRIRKKLVRKILHDKKVKEPTDVNTSKPEHCIKDNLNISKTDLIQDNQIEKDEQVSEIEVVKKNEKEISTESLKELKSSDFKVKLIESTITDKIDLNKVSDDEVDDDSRLVIELLKKSQKESKEKDKDIDETRDQSNKQNEKVNEDQQSPTHAEINQVKEDLISKVIENELNN